MRVIVFACLVGLLSAVSIKPRHSKTKELKAKEGMKEEALNDEVEDPKKATRKSDRKESTKGHHHSKKKLKTTVNETELNNFEFVPPKDEMFEAWYVNLDKSKDRKQCMEQQLMRGGMTPHRWQAVNWPSSCVSRSSSPSYFLAADTGMGRKKMESCMIEHKLRDCIGKHGIDMGLTAQHGSMKADTTKDEVRGHVISNWCSHKRLIDHLAERNTSAKYFVLLEDDTILSKKFKETIEDFVQNYEGEKWGSVQIDPWGHGEKIDAYKGMPIGRQFFEGSDGQHREFWGMHAWLIKKEALPKMVAFLEGTQTIPIDWIPRRQKSFISWKPNIAKNPESGRGATPSYCQNSIRQTTIG